MAAVRKPSGEDEVPLDEDRDTFEFPDFTAGIGETPDRPHFFSSTRRINYGDAAAPADVQLLSAPYVSTANEYDSPPASVASTDRRSGRSKATLAMSQYAEDVLDSRFNYEDVVTEVLVTYQSLSFEVVKMVNGKARTVRILHPASGSILPSTLGAIMGPSGCGKTTFLNMLAGRKLKGTPGGQVLFNGSPIKDVSRQLMSYVKQDDILLGSLTVRETLLFSALLRLPSSMGHKQKVQQVDRVISTLLLDKAANTRVGNEYIRGVSGGEKRRVSVGVDIVVEPSLILLDEPTTGLDSYSALILITVLRKLSFAGRTIVCTIHQPRTDIFEMFDDLILLVDGHLVYKGQTERALDYFAQQGYKCPPRVSPADFLLDTLATRGTGDLLQSNNLRKGSKFGRRMSTRYGTSDAWKMELDTSRQQLSRLSSASGSQLSRQMSNRNYALESRRTGMAAAEEPTNPKKVKPELYAVGMWRQFCLLCWRNTLNLFYNYLEYLVLFIVSLMFGVLLAVIFSGLRDCTSGPDPCSPLPEYKPDCRQQPPCSRSEENDATRSVGFYFFFMLAISNGFGVNAIPAGLEHRAVFHEEHERSMYRILPYWGAQMVVTAIPNALLSFAIVGVSYWFVGSIVLGGQEFLFAVLAVYLSIMCAMAISLTAVYLFIRMKVVLSLVSIALGLEVFFSSNVVTFDLIPGPVRWIFWLNQVQYAFNALMHNQYGTKNQIANDIFDHDKYDNKWIPLIGCGVCFVVLRIFALMAMWLAANQQEIMIQVYHVQSYMLKRAKGVATGVAKGVTAAPMNVIGSARDVASGVAKGVAKGVALMSGSRSDGMNSIMARVLDEQIVADAEDSAARDALGADGDDEVDEEVILRMGKGLKAEKPKEVDEEGKLEAKRKAKKEGGSKTVSYTEDTDHKDGGKGEGGPKDGAGKEVAPADVESKGDGAKDDKHRSTRMRMQSILVRRLHVTWDGLTYEVLKKVKSGGSAMVRVLQPSMGSIPPGTLGAIMGPSGSGKTTFLNILGGRSTGGVAGGSVEVNGKPLGPSTRKYMAYVKQQDFLLAALTVRETLLFSAMLRLPASIGPAERNARVERIIKGLLLQKSRNTLVGNVVIRGLSGGEKRRLSVGVDLVTEPSLILLDEPTSGLDAYSSLVLMAALQRLSQQGRTVLMTIHQPRTDIFEMFTELILLADGRLVYKGPVSASRARGPGVVEYFASLGFVAPPRINTADFLLDVLATPDQFNAFMNMEDVRSVDESQVGGADAGPPTPTGHDKNIIDKLRKCYENSDYYRQNREARVRVFQEQGLLGSPSAAGGADGEEGAGFQGGAPRKEEEAPKYATSLLTETVVLTMRFLLSAARDPEEYRNLFGQVVLFGALFAYVFSNIMVDEVGDSEFWPRNSLNSQLIRQVQAVLSFYGMTILVFVYCVLQNFIQYMDYRPVFVEESARQSYRPLSFYLAQTVVSTLVNFCMVFLYVLVAYWLIGFNSSWEHFMYIVYSFSYVCFVTACVFFNLGLSGSLDVCLVSGNLVVCGSILLSGFAIDYDNLQVWMRWAYFINFAQYSFSGLVLNEYYGNYAYILDSQVNGSYVPVATPAANLTAEDFYMLRRKLTMGDVVDGMPYELNQEGKWKMLGLLIATFTFYRVVGFLYIHYMSRGAKQVFKEPDLRKLQAEMKKMQRAKTKVARSRVGDTATTASPGNTPKASTPVKGLMARIQWAPVASRKIKQTQSQSQSQSQLSSIGGGGESPPNEREGVVSEAGTDGGGASSGTTAFMAMPVAR